MGYQITHMDYEDAVSQIGNYKFALLYKISGMELRYAESVKKEELDECFEARVFSADKELHFFGDSPKKVVFTADLEGEATLTEKYTLANRFMLDGRKKVIVKKYLATDRDGQVRIVLTRLSGLE